MKNKISIIAAIGAKNRVIGTSDGKIPWHISEDFKYFKEKTSGHPMIMGRKTFESLDGRILPDRPHVIVTTQNDYLDKAYIRPDFIDRKNQLFIVSNIEDALELANQKATRLNVNEIFIAGGGTIYHESIHLVDKLYLTLVIKKDGQEITGDVFFPEYEKLFTNIISKVSGSNSEYNFEFLELIK